MRIDIVSLFPPMFEAVLEQSILRRAQQLGHVTIEVHDLRDYAVDRHRSVDDRPYGGGPGMVLCPEPVFRAMEDLPEDPLVPARKILLTPQGRRFDQPLAREFSGEGHLVLLCGHYEGFDERIREAGGFDEISVGDFVLTGGEIPALLIIDAVVRLLPGVLGEPQSAEEDSFSDGLLDHPQYTRPPVFRGMEVPAVLRSGDHGAIESWRLRQRQERTRARRPGLWEHYATKSNRIPLDGGVEKESRDESAG